MSMGIRLLWVKLYSVRARKTAPQGILLTILILMLSIVALNFQVLTLAPQYATFGTQQYMIEVNGTQTYYDCCIPTSDDSGSASESDVLECSVEHEDIILGNCTMTQLAQFNQVRFFVWCQE